MKAGANVMTYVLCVQLIGYEVTLQGELVSQLCSQQSDGMNDSSAWFYKAK